MKTSDLTKHFMLIGSPVTHSLSPILHNIFAAQFGIEITYKLQEATVNNYRAVIEKFISLGGSGINITAPLKMPVFQYLKHIDANAQLAKAVNTLIISDNNLVGYNTDGMGLMRDLKRRNIIITGKNTLILGAGGAARGILGSLLEQKPNNIVITNRDIFKAKQIVSEFKGLGNIQVIESQDLHYVNADIIINATSSIPDYLDKLSFANTLCYDLNYTPETTQFMKTALINGALGAYNGLGMLVEQAAIAFTLWHKLCPNTQRARQMLKQQVLRI